MGGLLAGTFAGSGALVCVAGNVCGAATGAAADAGAFTGVLVTGAGDGVGADAVGPMSGATGVVGGILTRMQSTIFPPKSVVAGYIVIALPTQFWDSKPSRSEMVLLLMTFKTSPFSDPE